MKKINIFKALTILTAVIFTSIFITGCIPTTPTGNPTPSNQFDINISDEHITTLNNIPGQETVVKKVLVDGDSIEFSLTMYSFQLCGDCLEKLQIKFENSTSNYDVLVLNTADSMYTITTVATSVTIPNNIDTSYHWETLSNNIYTRSAATLYGSPFFQDLSNYGTNDRYLVFRKLKGSNYQYYWIKLKYPIGANYINGYLTILTGKYQLNSIITGQ
jgi:hypothetical protein